MGRRQEAVDAMQRTLEKADATENELRREQEARKADLATMERMIDHDGDELPPPLLNGRRRQLNHPRNPHRLIFLKHSSSAGIQTTACWKSALLNRHVRESANGSGISLKIKLIKKSRTICLENDKEFRILCPYIFERIVWN